ncbi:MAG: hypothetical protein Q7J80_13565, partial [Anaerolineales bacterium]|nr:hypothetical protein [Anaerolineales bacterium]
MNRRIAFLFLTALLLSACLSPRVEKTPSVAGDIATPDQSGSAKLTQAGEKFITFIKSEGIGNIAVEVTLPEKARYPEGAGIVVEVQTFLTERTGFYTSLDATKIGLIHVSYLWPGLSDRSGAKSDGDYDHARENGMQALRDVIHYAAGQIPDIDGKYLKESIAITPLTDNLGLYAFSHPGIAATQVMALYGDQLPEVKYFVGRENPTVDTLVSVEVGYFDDKNNPILNPLYEFPQDYSPLQIELDYSTIRWDPAFKSDTFVGRPYFDLNQNGFPDGGDHALNYRVPAAFDKRLYSVKLTQALLDNGALNPSNWPSDVATPQETAQWCPFWNVVDKYPALKSQSPNLKVMLVFADRDHVQPAPDKPHIHQAYDGFHNTASLWTRLNPDGAYMLWANPGMKGNAPDNAANTEPVDWLTAEQWSYADKKGAIISAPLAGVAEM